MKQSIKKLVCAFFVLSICFSAISEEIIKVIDGGCEVLYEWNKPQNVKLKLTIKGDLVVNENKIYIKSGVKISAAGSGASINENNRFISCNYEEQSIKYLLVGSTYGNSNPPLYEYVLNLYVDSIAENPEITPSSYEWYRDSVVLTASGSDSGSGVDYFEYSFDKINWSTGYFVEISNGRDTKVYFRMTDKVGNVSDVSEVIVNVDSEKPSIGYECNNGGDEKYVRSEIITVIAGDEISGIKKIEYKIGNGSWKELSGNTISVTENGIHEINIKTEDNAGNKAETNTFSVKIDNEDPVIEEVIPELVFDNTNETIIGVKAKVTASDKYSGINSYDVRVYMNGDNESYKLDKSDTENDTWIRDNLFERTRANKIYISVEVKDNAGNSSEIYKSEVALIPAKKMPAGKESIYVEENEEIETKIKVWPEMAAENGQTITYYYTRDLYHEGKVIGGTEKFRTILLYKTEDAKLYETFISDQKVSYKNAGSEELITDRIDIKSGFGHKDVQYKFSQEFEAWGKNYVESLEPINVTLANYTPEIRLIIECIEEDGSIKSEFIDMKNIPKEWNMKLSKNGLVNMGVQIFDYDIEKYKVELSQVKDIQFKDSNDKIEMHIPEIGAVLTGQTVYVGPDKKRLFKCDTLNNEKGYNLFPNPILLNFNTYTKYVLSVKEGSDEEKDTDAVIFYTEYSENGFILKVADGDYKENGITAQVYSEVKFNVKNEDESAEGFTWDFGDGTKEIKESEISHTYQQAADRKDGESLYKLRITNDKGNEAVIDVHIMDTEYGPMKGNEKWVGKHFVRGEVMVPNEIILTLGAEELEASAPRILLYGAQNKEKRGKITVCTGGCITSENKENVFFSEMKNTAKGFVEIKDDSEHSGWGGITAEIGSHVNLKDCEIRYADRALSVNGNGTDVVLKNVYIHDNDVGIHVLDGATVKLNDSVILKNRKYGIKEDGTESEVVYENCVIAENGSIEYPRNYYKAEETLIETE